MNKLAVALVAAIAVPAAAQNGAAWPVTANGRVCTAVQSVVDSGSGRLSVTYDAGAQEITLTSTGTVASPLPASGAIDLDLVLLDNGATKYDNMWATRHLTYTRAGDEVVFTTRFSGKENVAQILADLAASRRIGFLQKGEPILDHPLAGLAAAIPQLKACAVKAAA